MAGPIRIAVLADAGQARRELGLVANETSTLGSKFAKFGKAAAVGLAVAAAAAVKFGADSVKAASDAQQSVGATETVFGKFADTVIKTSNAAATAYGLSANEYRENANLLGALFKNQGVSMDELGVSTEKMIGRASDLAATFGGPTSAAVEALGAAFKGEFDSVEKFGISIKESTVSALLAKRGQDELTGAALAAAKQQAITTLIFNQSRDSMGAFGRESDTLAGQQQRLSAQFENIKATLGEALLPVLTKVATFVTTSVLPAVTKFIDQMKSGTGQGGRFATALDNAWVVLKNVVGYIVDHKKTFTALATVIAAITVAVKAWTAAQLLLNIALLANPIGLVIAAVALLVAGYSIAYQRSERFRKAADAMAATFRVLTAAVGIGAQAFMRFGARVSGETIPPMLQLVGIIQGAVMGALSRLGAGLGVAVRAWGSFKTAAIGAVNAVLGPIQWVIEKVQALIDKIQSIPGIPGGDMNANGTVTSNGLPRQSPLSPSPAGLAGLSTPRVSTSSEPAATGARELSQLITLAKQQNQLLARLIQVEAESPIEFGKQLNRAAATAMRSAR